MFLQKSYDSPKKIIYLLDIYLGMTVPSLTLYRTTIQVFIRISAAYFLRKANQITSIIITSASEQNLSGRYFVSKMFTTAPSSL